MDSSQKITFILNRHIGIIKGINKVFPNDHHGYCLFHLKYNMMDKLRKVDLKFRNRFIFLMTESAYAPDYESYMEKWECLVKEKGVGRGKVVEFLRDMPIQNWCNAFFIGHKVWRDIF